MKLFSHKKASSFYFMTRLIHIFHITFVITDTQSKYTWFVIEWNLNSEGYIWNPGKYRYMSPDTVQLYPRISSKVNSNINIWRVSASEGECHVYLPVIHHQIYIRHMYRNQFTSNTTSEYCTLLHENGTVPGSDEGI